MSHPYSRKLFDSIPKPGDSSYLLNTISGMVPPATDYGAGCQFADRCQFTLDVCHRQDSEVYMLERGHDVRCHLFKDSGQERLEEDKARVPAPQKSIQEEALITLRKVKTWFPVRKGIFRTVSNHVRAVDEVDLEIKRGSTMALVGESGCGKTTLGESILRLNREAVGEADYRGKNLLTLGKAELKEARRHLQIVFQDPFGSLSPRMRVKEIVGEGLTVHFPDLPLRREG